MTCTCIYAGVSLEWLAKIVSFLLDLKQIKCQPGRLILDD